MKIFEKKKEGNRRIFYIFGKKVLSYKKKLSKYDKIYAKRFKGLTREEERYILEYQFERMAGYKLNLDNPQTFNEKLQWLKLNYKNPLMTKYADKVAVRGFVKEKIGEQHLTPVIGVYDNVDDIDFDSLPEKFVAKVNWGSGQNIIVTNKSKLDIIETKRKLRDWMQPESNHYYNFLEWVYKDIEPKIIIEEFLEALGNSALDYKFMCFNGKPYYCWVSNKNLDVQERSFYNMDWVMQDMELVEPPKIKAKEPLAKPENFDEMVSIANKLCQDFPFIRVDLYKLNDGSLKFGELTFIPASGYSPWAPAEVDKKLGDLIDIEQLKKEIKECDYYDLKK